MSFNFNSYNNTFNINIKNKWINEYKNLNEKLKDEELDLLKLFLVKNYHLNKVYKKYVYKDFTSNNSYYENNRKKIKSFLSDLVKSKNEKKKKNFQDLISSIKIESNKKYELLLKEEIQLKNDLKKFDQKIIVEYDKEIENWINEYNNNTNKNNTNINNINITNNSSILLDNENNMDYDKEEREICNIFNLIDNKKEKNIKYRTIDKLKYYKYENYKKEDIKNNNNLIGNLNIKKNNENIIRLTSAQIPTKFIDILNQYDDPLENYLNFILKDIDIDNNFISKKDIKKLYTINNNNTIINEEKNFEKNMDDCINKIIENKKINYFKIKIKYISNIIKDKLGGIYLGWTESEHNEFLILKNFYKDKSNSFIFLTSLNNIFPYMNIAELKKHIKLYDIYLKLDKIKKILIEKYNQLKNKIEIDKSRISKQTSTSITKSTSSIINRNIFPKGKKNKMSFDFGNSYKSFYYNTNSNFFDKEYKTNVYLRTNYSKNHKNTINNNNKFRKNKEKIIGHKNYSSISLNHSRDKIFNYSYNIYKKGKIKNFFNKYENKK